MLSNIFNSNDSCGSDSADSLLGTDTSSIDQIRVSADLDHNYQQIAFKTALNPFLYQNSQQITPLMSDTFENFLDIADMTAFDDFANAPTPLMSSCFATFEDIESDDLLDYNLVEIKPVVNTNNSSFDLPSVENEVEIAVSSSVPLKGQVSQSAQMSVPNEVQSRPQHSRNEIPCKRFKTTESYDQFPDTDDEEDEETEAQPKRKSKAGRKPSKGPNKCMSRNAIAARENRERKKAYIEDMEKRFKLCEEENRKMKSIVTILTKKNEELNEENKYYRGVLNNDSMISKVIKQLSEANPIELIGNQMVATKTNNSSEANADSKVRKSSRIASKTEHTAGYSLRGETSGYSPRGETSGICLHVHNNKVSLEFCAKCSVKHKKAK